MALAKLHEDVSTALDMTRSKQFRRALLAWYRKHGRDLPWRRTRDPYAVLVSEFMLQQTQVATVLPYYEKWMQRFPTFSALSAAEESDVLHAWQGLGYYNRARNLHATAQLIVQQHGGKWQAPQRAGRRGARAAPTLWSPTKLPGVGRYTANAVATFAFDLPVAIVEANIARVLTRVNNIAVSIDSAAGRGALWSAAEALLPGRGAARFNSALIDLGALVCTRRPACSACPVKRFCRARDPLRLPVKTPNAPPKYLTENHAFDFRRGKVLLEQSTGRWRGMWILPRSRRLRTKPLYQSEFPFTNHRITLAVFRVRTDRKAPNQSWYSPQELQSIPIPSPHRRALRDAFNAIAEAQKHPRSWSES